MRLWNAAIFALYAACGPVNTAGPTTAAGGNAGTAAVTAPDESRPKGAWDACYSNFSPDGNAVEDLKKLARACGATGGMHPLTGVQTGQQSQSDPVQRFTFTVPTAGRCYRVYAAGDAGVRDLDVLIRDPAGGDVTGDVTHDSWPVVPPAGPACFEKPGIYVLEVSVYQGTGKFALQVWGS